MFRETQVTWMGLGAALLLMFNLPENAARGLKSAVRELLAPYQVAVASLGGWRPARSASSTVPQTPLDAGAVDLRTRTELERENAELRRLLGYARRLPRHLVSSTVIARDGEAGWWRSIRLDRGSEAGVGTNDIVVTEAGLVGVVRDVSPHTADVLLISDPGCRIAVSCSRTRDFGLLTGGGMIGPGGVLGMLLPAAPAEMTFIPRESGIRDGDEIVTSGLGGVFPEGFLVGYVKTIQPARSGLYLEARVEAAADLGRLRHVLVITGFSPATPGEEEP